MTPKSTVGRAPRRLCLCLAGLALTVSVPAALTHRGFTIDETAVSKLANLDAIVAATKEQIDIVHAVGLPPEILAFVQGVKFRLMPADAFKSSTPGRYMGNGDESVQVSAAIVRTGHKPVLLHELLHAFHDQRVADGYGNRQIREFYRTARALPVFAAKSHMMANEKEYFACAATAYLFGVTAQEPFRREKVRDNQPAFHEFLRQTFGPAAGSFAGSLTK